MAKSLCAEQEKNALPFWVYFALIAALFFVACGDDGTSSSGSQTGTMTDPRDGQTYRIVTIGEQTWMAENLNYKTDSSWCYNSQKNNCSRFGRLYTWGDAAKACPAGWHLPDTTEWNILMWGTNGHTNDYGFNWLAPDDIGYWETFWTSTLFSIDAAYRINMYYAETMMLYESVIEGSFPDAYENKNHGYSVRCLKDAIAESFSTKEDLPNCTSNRESKTVFVIEMDSTYTCENGKWVIYVPPIATVETLDDLFNCTAKKEGERAYVMDKKAAYMCSDGRWQQLESSSNLEEKSSSSIGTSTIIEGSLIDSRDGQIYKTVTIGEQTWMLENLNYNAGNSFCFDDVDSNCIGNGRLYTWSAALNACPNGWYLPTKTEWEEFISSAFFSSTFSAGYWENLGYRDNKGNYEAFCDGFLWSSTERSNYYAYYTHWNLCDRDPLELGVYRKDFGFPVRCIKRSSMSSQTSSSTEIVSSPSIEDTLIDVRDGQIYRTVKIGGLVWMGENLNYKMDKSFCYDNQEHYCAVYGRLYTWAAALKSCPSGWHLPDSLEWNSLIAATGMEGRALKSSFSWDGSDDYLFSALPAGYGYGVDKYFMREGQETYFWSSTTTLEERTRIRSLDLPGLWWELKDSNNVNSVRCVRNELLTDLRDGQTYRTVKIGTQVWMAENLNYKVDSSFCYNDSAKYCEKYGRLYTWNSATTICPIGWHLPDTTEWKTLFAAVDGSGVGSALKSTYGWAYGDNGSDDFEFSALPAGYRNLNGSFRNEGNYANFWSSTEKDGYGAYSMDLNYGNGYANLGNDLKNNGFSVRCLKDSE